MNAGWLTLALVWLSLILVASVVPVSAGVSGETLDVGHVFSYAVLTFLWVKAIGLNHRSLAVSIALTPLTETIQLFTPWRHPSLFDVGNNLLGVLISLALLFAFRHMKKNQLDI